MFSRRKNCAILFFFVLLGSPLDVPASDFGESGLITVPSALHQSDGYLTATIASNQISNTFNLTYQATPWLEATFRYSVFNPYSKTFSRDLNRDRSYGAKLKIREEDLYLPAISIGIRDILGTGVWNGEYVVATKNLRTLQVSMGLGWGRFADRDRLKNPLRFLHDGFATRPDGLVGGERGGEVRGQSFFRGPVGIFGGLKYPISRNLALMVERNSDGYERELRLNSFSDRSSINLGIEWKPWNFLSATVSFQQGDFVGLTVRSVGDFKAEPARRGYNVESTINYRASKENPGYLDFSRWYDKLLYDAERTGLKVYQASYKPGSNVVDLVMANKSYGQTADAINQMLLLSNLHLPPRLDYVRLHLLEDEFPAATIEYVRPKNPAGESSRVFSAQRKSFDSTNRVRVLRPELVTRPTHVTDFGYPHLWLGADLGTRIQVMDPDAPLKHQLYLKGTASVSISSKVNLWGSYSLNLDNNFDANRASDSVLPRVRSEINKYLTEGVNGIDSLYFESKSSLSAETHVRVYAGILEEMFGGVGGEILWSPFTSRVAFGLSSTWAKQRGFSKDFSFRDYSVLTGHFSAFYASPWYSLDIALHAGRYLAGDYGYTLESRRTFDNGFAIGAFFSRTNVSKEDFGEGSFDKGLYISIPFSLFSPFNTRSSYRTLIRPVERDGGRRLEGFVGELWWNRRAVRFDGLGRGISRMSP